MATNNVTNYDYQDLRSRIQEKLKNKQGWGDGYESTVGQILIDTLADAADNLSYMLERRSQESFQTTARLRSSVASRASELGYRSRRASAANGYVTLRLVDENGVAKPVAAGGEVVIPEGTPMTFDEEAFYTTAEYIIEEGMSEIDMAVSQGVVETLTFNPATEETFTSSQYILIPDYEYIDENSIVVISEGIEYRDVKELDQQDGIGIGALSFAGARTQDGSSAYYDIRYAHDGMRIQFGDDLFGRTPEDTITVTIVRTKGEQVRVLSVNNEFRFEFDTFSDGINVTPPNEYEYLMTNNTQIVGGRAPETLEEIRTNAPLFITTNNRAVSLDGYGYWARRSNIGGIIDSRAFAESEIDTLLYNINNVYIAYLTETGVELSVQQKQDLIDFIKERDVALAHIVPRPASEIQLGMDLSVKRNAELQIAPEDLYLIIRAYIMEYYKRREGSIGIEYQKSDFIRDAYNLQTRVAGVDYNVVDFIDVDIFAYQIAEYPLEVNDCLIRLRNDGATAQVGDEFTLLIDNTPYTVTVEADDLNTGEFYVNMLFKMRDYLYTVTELISAVNVTTDGVNNEFILQIKTRDGLGGFRIDTNAGDFAADTIVNFKLQIHPKIFNNEFEDILLRNGVYITDSNGDVLYYDNGEGFWVDADTGDIINLDPQNTGGGSGGEAEIPTQMIDYITANLTLPTLPTGTYYVKYRQDKYENFKANSATAVTLIPPKEEYDDVAETFTKINLIPV